MPDIETTAPVAETAPATESVPAGGAEPQRQPLDVASAIDGMTDAAEIGNLLFGREPEPPAPAPADPEPAGKEVGEETPPQADPEPTASPAAGEQPQPTAGDDETPPAEPQAPSDAPDRISLRSLHPDDRMLIVKAKEMVREGTAPSLAVAIATLTKPEEAGTQEPAPAAQTTEPPAPAAKPQPVEPESQVAEITSRLADLRAKRKTAVEEFNRPEELELTAQIEDALAELADAKAHAVVRNRESTLQQQTLQSVIEDIYVDHPESEDPKSYFSYRMSQEVDAYVAAHGPIQQHPQQLKAIAARVAKELGQAKPAAQPKPAATPPPPKQTLRPVGAAAPGSAATPRSSPDQIQRLIDSASAEDLHAVLFGPA